MKVCKVFFFFFFLLFCFFCFLFFLFMVCRPFYFVCFFGTNMKSSLLFSAYEDLILGIHVFQKSIIYGILKKKTFFFVYDI